MHRDIKTENILLTSNGILKIADFGLSREWLNEPGKCVLSTNVVTLWYRAPELLLGEVRYSSAIDIWSAGCVVCELWIRNALFPGNSEVEQIDHITRICGDISPNIWEDVVDLPLYKRIDLPTGRKRCLSEMAKHFSKQNDAVDLIDQLLQFDPKKRISARDAVNHDFFWFDPIPSDLKSFAESISNIL